MNEFMSARKTRGAAVLESGHAERLMTALDESASDAGDASAVFHARGGGGSGATRGERGRLSFTSTRRDEAYVSLVVSTGTCEASALTAQAMDMGQVTVVEP
jgi:hypothetical protein